MQLLDYKQTQKVLWEMYFQYNPLNIIYEI